MHHSQPGESNLDPWNTYILGVRLLAKQGVALEPRDVGLVGAHGVVIQLCGVADLIKPFLGTSAGESVGQTHTLLIVVRDTR